MTNVEPNPWAGWLAAQAHERETAGLTRRLVPRAADSEMFDLAGNDYLGLLRRRRLADAAAAAAATWGTGAGASRLVTGTTALHADLEQSLADFVGAEAALVTSTGYHANLSVVTALADPETLIVSDEHIHASLIDAARLSRATITVVRHNDLGGVRRALAAAGNRRVLILAESVYSVLGDAAPLVELAGLAETSGALLVVDEAHGLGVAGPGGRGLLARHHLAGARHVVMTATLSKALASQGGAILAGRRLIDHLVNRARPFVYDTGLAPPAAAAALAALRILADDPALPAVVAARAAALAERLGVPVPAGAVLSVPLCRPDAAASARAAVRAQAYCRERGVLVGCFRPPSTPDQTSRLRVTVNAGLAENDWQAAAGIVAAAVRDR
ncbi:MAG: aminotransferase class I/II-fold pyridoxal phosphate-dependent enzyme [Nocardioides sp.]